MSCTTDARASNQSVSITVHDGTTLTLAFLFTVSIPASDRFKITVSTDLDQCKPGEQASETRSTSMAQLISGMCRISLCSKSPISTLSSYCKAGLGLYHRAQDSRSSHYYISFTDYVWPVQTEVHMQ